MADNQELLQSQEPHAMLGADAVKLLSMRQCAELERQVIPFLQALRKVQGKPPIYIPKE